MPDVAYVRDNEIGLLTLNRSASLNALNSGFLREIGDHLEVLALDPPRCLIVMGGGEKAFVAGADIGEMRAMTAEESAQYSASGNRVMSLFEEFPCPVIAAVNGYCLGGGLELALACDLRIASESAVFAFPEAGLGIPPGFGGMQRLVRVVGIAKAKELIYTARRVKAPEALSLGLVNEICLASDLLERAQAVAAAIAKNAPLALRAAKNALNAGTGLGQREAAALETRLFSNCFETKDQQNAMGAFVEKRDHEPFIGE